MLTLACVVFALGIGALTSHSTLKKPPSNSVAERSQHRAVLVGNIDGLKAALKSGANMNARDARGWTALIHATNNGYAVMLELLLEAKANLDARA